MKTVLAYLEEGYEVTYEHLAFRQLKGAYQCELVCIGHDFDTPEEALASVTGTKVFLLPPGRSNLSVEMADFVHPEGDVVYIFGRPSESMVRFIEEGDLAVHITTPGATDMMAVSVAGIVLNEYR
jgi:hypothetical protein